jgi:hypothetical protein
VRNEQRRSPPPVDRRRSQRQDGKDDRRECGAQHSAPALQKGSAAQQALPGHDDTGTAKQGDTVEIIETKPISANKRWALVQVIKKGD